MHSLIKETQTTVILHCVLWKKYHFKVKITDDLQLLSNVIKYTGIMGMKINMCFTIC